MTEPVSPPAQNPPPAKTVELDRLRGFSDGIFSIAATLLVLQLRPPDVHGSSSLLAGLLREWPQLIAYAGAFLAIGGSWLGHRAIVASMTRDTAAVHVANLLVLLVVAFVPFPALLVANCYGRPQEDQAAALLSASLATVGVTLIALDRLGRTSAPAASRPRPMLRPELRSPSPGEAGPVLYAVAAVLCLWMPNGGLLLDLAISAVFLLAPTRLTVWRRR